MQTADVEGRCWWAAGDPLLQAYHDQEWGVPLHDDRKLFELLSLEGAQAGLSWLSILKRRAGYRQAFANFEPAAVAASGDDQIQRILGEADIIRNRRKVESVVENARCVLQAQRELGSFEALVWSFVGGTPIDRAARQPADVPATSPESEQMSRALRKRGCTFVGPTICYAFMQAAGLVNDHLSSCPARSRIRALSSSQSG